MANYYEQLLKTADSQYSKLGQGLYDRALSSYGSPIQTWKARPTSSLAQRFSGLGRQYDPTTQLGRGYYQKQYYQQPPDGYESIREQILSGVPEGTPAPTQVKPGEMKPTHPANIRYLQGVGQVQGKCPVCGASMGGRREWRAGGEPKIIK